MTQKFILISGALYSALAVIIGAFGAHALKATLEATQRLDTFETAVKYHFYHSLGLLIIGLLWYKIPHKFLTYAAWSHTVGLILFSGSLYILCLTNNGKWGAITPLGGLAFILGWILVALAVYRGA